ncbi:Replication protein A 70 kDa DNA-binding subunit B [Camellia lanceoleosa]|uniref:Replication protein A 70 kDa DNA-binding subunit B n=1 Tax=Camellia lanceoleosa TaxID=1840588 RepID=A0ACC0G4L4_9ERIC|nr:Replication protein A 70 kDa DNA-binding subunit B [Camellia lanceoleosa]
MSFGSSTQSEEYSNEEPAMITVPAPNLLLFLSSSSELKDTMTMWKTSEFKNFHQSSIYGNINLYFQEIMCNQLLAIKDINPSTKRWTSNVMVIEKSFPRTRSSGILFQKLMLIDAKGSKVQATIFGADIEVLQTTLEIFSSYAISNAQVRSIPEQHQIVENEYQWTIHGRTSIEKIKDDQLTIRSLNFNFTTLTALENNIDSTTSANVHSETTADTQSSTRPKNINVLLAILEVGPIQMKKNFKNHKDEETPLQEIIVIDDQLKPTTLTL